MSPRLRSSCITLAITLASSLVFVGTARGDYLQCKGLSGDRAACDAAVEAKCKPLKKYWDRRRCEHAIVIGSDTCLSQAFISACRQATPLVSHCSHSSSTGFHRPERLARWVAKARAYSRHKQALLVFFAKWGKCLRAKTKDDSCRIGTTAEGNCKGAEQNYQRVYRDAVDSLVFRHGRGSDLDLCRAAIKKGKLGDAASLGSLHRQKVQRFIRLNRELPAWLRYKERELLQQAQELDLLEKRMKKAFARVLAKRRCPRGRNNIRSVVARFRPLVKRRFESTGRTTLKAFRLNGPKYKSYDRRSQTAEESYPAIACLEERPRDRPKFCQWIKISIRRSKPRGSGWTSWQVSVGANQQLLCKFVR